MNTETNNEKDNSLLENRKKNLKRHSSTGKLKKNRLNLTENQLNRSNILNTSKYSVSSVNHYLERRHFETQEKISILRTEQMNTEQMELREKPQLSKNSLLLAEKLGRRNVFDRLTNNSQNQKNNEELIKIEKINSKVQEKPTINGQSQLLIRTIDDLYNWKTKVDTKKERKYEEELNVKLN